MNYALGFSDIMCYILGKKEMNLGLLSLFKAIVSFMYISFCQICFGYDFHWNVLYLLKAVFGNP